MLYIFLEILELLGDGISFFIKNFCIFLLISGILSLRGL